MAKTYGAWKISEEEYKAARRLVVEEGPHSEEAYQLVRYCRGEIFCRDDAERAVKAIRASAP